MSISVCETGPAGAPGAPGFAGPGAPGATGAPGFPGGQGATGYTGKYCSETFSVNFSFDMSPKLIRINVSIGVVQCRRSTTRPSSPCVCPTGRLRLNSTPATQHDLCATSSSSGCTKRCMHLLVLDDVSTSRPSGGSFSGCQCDRGLDLNWPFWMFRLPSTALRPPTTSVVLTCTSLPHARFQELAQVLAVVHSMLLDRVSGTTFTFFTVHHLHHHHLHLLSLVQSFILNLRRGSSANRFFHRSFPFLPDWFRGLFDYLMFLFCTKAGFVCMVC